MKNLVFILFLTFLILSGCRIPKENKDHTSDSPVSNEMHPQLIFLTFKIVKDSTKDHSEISLLKKQLTDGKLKKNTMEDMYKPSCSNSLRCVFFTEKGDTLSSVIVEHPLFKKYEYMNDDSSIGFKDIQLEESTFAIRTDFDKQMKYIVIFESTRNKSEAEIAKIDLTF